MKKIGLIVVVILVLIGGIRLLNQNKSGVVAAGPQTASSNVHIVDGKQVITINAKGGYYPRTTVAKANVPTIINVMTNGTFDCSAALTIPAINNRTFLPPNGVTPIEIPAQNLGSSIKGVCSMGMYNFTIQFN